MKTKMKETTLGEWGNKLPIGIKGKSRRDFTFKSWGLDEEKEISEMKRKSTTMGPFVNQLLSYMIKDFCGESFENKDINEKLITFNQLILSDVLYMYLYLRYDQLDELVRMDVTCNNCGKINKDFTANMEGLDVDVLDVETVKIVNPVKTDSPKQPEAPDNFSYKLRKPFKLGDDKIEVSTIKLKRTPWDAMERASDEVTTNQGMLTELIFQNSIVGINDEIGYVDMDKLLKGFRKTDFERMSNAINKYNGGPTLRISDKCRYCSIHFYKQLDWGYDSFFGSSSLPQD